MSPIARLVSVLVLAALPTLCVAAEARQIGWHDLVPPVAPVENPFASLTEDQMDALRTIVRLEARAERDADAAAGAEAEGRRAELTEAGLDVDGLFRARLEIMQAREAAATGVNEGLLDTTVRLPGYVLPLEFKNRRAVEFLLVPTVGACIHTPPPPANQVVHVVHPEGIEVTGLFTPVWVEGRIRAERSIQDVGYSDGSTAVNATYRLDASMVEMYK